MNKRWVTNMFVYFLVVSFLSLMSGYPVMAAETKGLPMGEMVSKGEVKHEVSKNVWEPVPPASFPVFPGTKVKTEKGVATIRLSNNSQIGIYSNSSLSFDQSDRFTLLQGNIEFYVPSTLELKVQAGSVSIVKPRVQQAGNGPAGSSSKDEETFGSIFIQPNGSITVKSVQGKLLILNRDNSVVAALSPKESVTISTMSGGKLQVAQAAGGEAATTTGSGPFLGISGWGWVGVGAAAVATGVGVGLAAGGGSGGGGGGGGAVCP